MNANIPLDFSHYMPVELLSGPNVLLEKGERLKKLGRRCLVVTGAHSAKASGALQDVERVLKEQGIIFTIFDQVKPNPLVSDCQQAAILAREQKADFIIGIGGGSPLDSAKVVALLATNSLDEKALYSLNWSYPPLPTVLIGTTAGTGSELTMVSVLTNGKGQKKSITAPALYPVLSFADPRYTVSCHYETTLSCALDALCHGIEGYFSLRSNFLTDSVAAAVIPRLMLALQKLSDNEAYRMGGEKIPLSLREELYYGSLLAGFVLNSCGAGFPHTMGYVLTEQYSVLHGRACAAYLPEFLSLACHHLPQKWSALGLSLEETRRLLFHLNPLPQIHMSREKIEALLSRYENNKNFHNSPGMPTEEDARKWMLQMWCKE